MGHKVHPTGFRIGVIRDWQAKWYADKHYAEFLQEDLKLRAGIQLKYGDAAVSLVEIERQANRVSITIYTARPGIVIGRGGQRVDETRAYLEQLIGKRVQLNIQEVQRPELDAYLVAKTIAEQIERRVAFRRAMKQTTLRTMQAGAKGMRVSCAGRLGGAEIARRLTMHEGQVPLHTLRADIDYGFIEARTTMGRIGVKVWIYKGDVLPEPKVEEIEEELAEVVAEGAPAEEVEEKPAEVVAEVAPAEEAEEKPAKVTRKRRAKAAPPAEAKVEEKPAEVVAEVAPAEEVEEKPAKPARKRRAKAAPPAEAKEEEVEEKPAEVVAEAASAEEVEEKPAKVTRRRRAKAAPPAEAKEEVEEKPAEVVAEVAPAEEVAEKPAKPARKRRAKAEAEVALEEAPAEKAEAKPAKTTRKRKTKAETETEVEPSAEEGENSATT